MAVGTLNAMIARIVLELGGRTDLQLDGTIADAINDAVKTYQKMRFRWNETAPLSPFLMNMTVGQPYYDRSADERIGRLLKVDWIDTVIGSTREALNRREPHEIYLALETGQQVGQPLEWAFDGNSLIFYPQPDQAWPLYIGGYLAIAAPTLANGDQVGNVWMNQAERLIRSRAKYEIALHRTRNIPMQKAMSPSETGNDGLPGATADALSELLAENSRIVSVGRVRAMRF